MLMDANARMGRKIGESLQDGGIFGACWRDELNENNELLLTFAFDNGVAVAKVQRR